MTATPPSEGNPPNGWEPAPYPAYPGYPAGVDPGEPAALNDPLVPVDFGGWFRRVFEVFRHSFGQLAQLAVLPALLVAGYLIAIDAARPALGDIQRELAESGVGPGMSPSPMVAFEVIFGRLLPIMLVFLVLMVVVGAFYQGAAFYLAIRRADGGPGGIGEALRFAAPRVAPFIGWSLLAGIVSSLLFAVPVLPGVITQSAPLISLGVLVGLVLGAWFTVVVFGSLFGVVLLERAGLGRCFRLIKGRFWVTFGRLLVAGLIYLVYSFVLGLVTGVLTVLLGAGAGPVVSALVEAVLMVPGLVYLVAVVIVTYAGLRHQENSTTSTRTLAAELAR